MTRTWLVALVVVLLGAAIIAGSANVIGHHGDTDSSTQAGYVPPRPERVGDPLDRLIWDARVMRPHRHGGLTIFPIELRDERSDFRPRTFDEAIERGDLIVREVGGGSVNEVQVRNHGRQPVFILSGEIMTGSKQDRIASADTLIPARSGWVLLDVYCVEHGRWEKISDTFGSKGSLVNSELRQMAQAAVPQSEVWEGVAAKAGSVGVSQSDRGAFNEIYDSESVQDRLGPYRRKLGSVITSRTAGVAAAAHGRIIAIDLFANPSLLRALWDKLLDSYSLDAMEHLDTQQRHETSEQDVLKLLRWAESDSASRRKQHTPGSGYLFSLRSDRAEGFMLSYRDETVHANVFEPRHVIIHEPTPRRILPQQLQ